MSSADFSNTLPLAATMDLQYRLPPFQQILFNPTIGVSLGLLLVAIVVVIYLSHRARVKAKLEARLDALKMAEKILLKRGGTPDEVEQILYAFTVNPRLDPAAIVMIRERFQQDFRPALEKLYGNDFGQRMETVYFPPPKDTRRAIGKQEPDLKTLVEERRKEAGGQTAAAILDLMDATLRPGSVLRLTFSGQEGGYGCLVMGHDMQAIDVTLPANNNQLVAALSPGTGIEGSLESGPSLLAFTSEVIQAVAGSMPYCRIAAWKSVWEIRKRDSMRLPMSLELDFHHISTSADSIRISNLSKELGAIRPGRLLDISLGGCCIDTHSDANFRVGDMIRFSQSLIEGTPPATLLGAVVNIDPLDPERNEGAKQRLHVQFLVIDDVSQRILARTLRQLQDVADKDDWLQAQTLMQRMRRNNIPALGSPNSPTRRKSTRVLTAVPVPGAEKPKSAGTTRHQESAREGLMPRPGQGPAKRKLSSESQSPHVRPPIRGANRMSTRLKPSLPAREEPPPASNDNPPPPPPPPLLR